MPRLTKRILDAVKSDPAREIFVWCSALPGFGARVYPSGAKIFIAQVRVGRAQRRIKIGRYNPYTVDQARVKAEEAIRAAGDGIDPQRVKQERKEALTVSELCDLYMQSANAGRVLTRFGRPKKPSTLINDTGRIERHVKPVLGRLIAKDLKPSNLARLADAISSGETAIVEKSAKPRGKAVVTGGPIAAARVVELVGGIWSWAAERDYVPARSITKSVRKLKAQPNERILSSDELKALGAAIRAARADSPLAAYAVRLLALLGARREEVVKLTLPEVDLLGSCLQLGDTKTGRSTRAVGAEALAILKELVELKLHDLFLFPNSRGDGPADLKKQIAAIFDKAGLKDVRSQTLRRTFASIGDELGYSDPIIGALLGHAKQGVTQKHYIRRPDAALVAAATRISDRISAAMSDKTATDVVQLSMVGAG